MDAFVFVAGFCIGCVGLAFLLIGIGQSLLIMHRAKGCDTPVTGYVAENVPVKASRSGAYENITWNPVIKYEFDGEEHSFVSDFGMSEKRKYVVGEPIELLVNPNEPRRYRILDKRVTNGRPFFIVGGILIVAGIVMLLVGNAMMPEIDRLF